MRSEIIRLADKSGMKVASAGTHPFSSWADQLIYPDARYAAIVEEMQLVARANLIFGLHVHVGIADRALALQIMNEARYFLPHLLALSTNSPFWMGRNTGLKSYRSVIFRNFPRTGIPPFLRSWTAYEELLDSMVRTGCIPNGSKIWWDVRPNWNYPTLEFRICDVCTRVDEAVCVAAILQAVIAKLWKLRRDNLTFRVYASPLIEENKWRAVRYGLGGKLIDFGKDRELPAPELIRELLEWFVADVVDELGSRKEVEYAFQMLRQGSSADRQLATYARTNDLKAVVDQLIEETNEGLTSPGMA